MGSAMARNLVGAGLRTTVWGRSPSATLPLSDAGALVATSPEEAILDARLVITMLPTAAVVESVIFGDGAAEAFSQGAVWAQMVDLAIRAAGDDELPLLAALSRQWRAAVDGGHGREDVSAARLALGDHMGGGRP
jgi:hypothetical protein